MTSNISGGCAEAVGFVFPAFRQAPSRVSTAKSISVLPAPPAPQSTARRSPNADRRSRGKKANTQKFFRSNAKRVQRHAPPALLTYEYHLDDIIGK